MEGPADHVSPTPRPCRESPRGLGRRRGSRLGGRHESTRPPSRALPSSCLPTGAQWGPSSRGGSGGVRRGREGVWGRTEHGMKGHRSPGPSGPFWPLEGRGTQDPPSVCGTRGPRRCEGSGGRRRATGWPGAAPQLKERDSPGWGDSCGWQKPSGAARATLTGPPGFAQHRGSRGNSPALRPAPLAQGLLWDQVCPERNTSRCIWGDLEERSSPRMPLAPRQARAGDGGRRVRAQGWGTAALAHPGSRGKACRPGTSLSTLQPPVHA